MWVRGCVDGVCEGEGALTPPIPLSRSTASLSCRYRTGRGRGPEPRAGSKTPPAQFPYWGPLIVYSTIFTESQNRNGRGSAGNFSTSLSRKIAQADSKISLLGAVHEIT